MTAGRRKRMRPNTTRGRRNPARVAWKGNYNTPVPQDTWSYCNGLTEVSGATMPVASSVHTWGPWASFLCGLCNVSLTASEARQAVYWSDGRRTDIT